MDDDAAAVISTLCFLLWTAGAMLFFGRYAWHGLSGRPTFTLGGFRAGRIGRVFGVIYILLIIYLLWDVWPLLEDLQGLTLTKLSHSLQYIPPPQPAAGLAFVVMSLVFALLLWLLLILIRRRYVHKTGGTKVSPPTPPLLGLGLNAIIFSIPGAMFTSGLLTALGAPLALTFGLVVIWGYFFMIGFDRMLSRAPDERMAVESGHQRDV
jgi:hypothetical protein